MLSILTVNIGAAARQRAEVLLAWLAARPEDVFVLTETSNGPGTAYLLEQFRTAGSPSRTPRTPAAIAGPPWSAASRSNAPFTI